jgi:hypothetical protein
MTAASLAWPSSRIVAGWWPELADLHPQRLWLSSWRLHHIEALVTARRPSQLDPLSTGLLHLLDGPAPIAANEIPARLQLEPAMAARLLQGLASTGLASPVGNRWMLTAAGRECRASGAVTVHSRRSFHFLDRRELHQPPHFLSIDSGLTVPLEAGPDWRFDPAVLADCVRRAATWKERYGFPREVEAILLPRSADSEGVVDWQRVLLDRPEQLLVLLAERPAAEPASGTRIVAFPVQPQGWLLQRKSPALEVGPGWEEVFPDLQQPSKMEEWWLPWRSWCQSRALPSAEVDASELTPDGCVLRVRIPRMLAERLRASRGEANRPAQWVLAGSGRTRALARLEIVEKT